MKAIKYITFVLVGLLLFSCEVDYEADPNNSETAPTSGLFNRVQKRLMDRTHEAFFQGRQFMTWVQYWNQVNYTEEDRFQYRETSNKGGWDDFYTNAQDLVDIITFNTDEATKDDMAKYGPNVNQVSSARIMLVYIYLQAAELWGDVPYWSYGGNATNASFQANMVKSADPISAPAYAKESEMYPDMIKELKEAADAFVAGSANTGDNFYGGDITQWKKFANSLRLRIANRIKGVYPAATAEIADAVADGVFTSNADNAGLTYENNALNGAPWYRAFVVNARTDFAPSGSLVELLQGKRGPFGVLDPRLDVYCADNDAGFKVGIPLTGSNAEVNAFVGESLPGDAVLAANFTELYMGYPEVCFIMSENNGWDQDWYEKGVAASMDQWGVSAADKAAYMATLPAANAETVMTQKYIALYMQPMEAWSEYRRLGYPHHFVKPGVEYTYTWPISATENGTMTYTFSPIGGLTDLPTRNKYLLNEGNINAANLAAAVTNMGGDTQSTKLWWMP